MDTFYYIGQTGEENQTNFNISGKQFIREDLGIDVATGDIYNLKIQTGALNSRVTTIEGDYLTSAYISDSIVNGETDTAPSRNAVYDMSGFLQSQINMSVTTGDATGITLQAVTDNGSNTTNFIDVGGISSVGTGTFDNDLKISNLDKSLIFSSSKAKIYYNESISGGLVQESKNGFSFYIDNENNEDTSKFRVYSNKTPDSDTSSIFQISQNGDTYISGNIINTALTNFTGDTSSSISFLNTATGTINTNLFSTGSNLQTQITTLNTATGTLKTALVSTGSDLSTRIFSTGSNLQTQITTLNTATGIIKTNLAATGSDLLARLISTGGSLTTSITTLNTATGTINTALATTGSDLSARLISTGGSLTTSITTLNTATGTINTNLATTGSNLQTQITTLNTATGIIKTNLAATGSDLSARLISTGGSLTTSITTLNTATGTINTALATTGSDLSARLISTGGSLSTILATEGTSESTRILNPIGGSYQTSTPTKTGAIKITLPVSWTNTMLCFKVSVFDFAAGESFTIFLAGYNYSGGWYYTSAYIIGGTTVDRNFTVRFGHDGSNCCVYIGELASTWGYPQIGISEVLLGFSNYSASSWRTGWSISFEASAFSSVSSTITSTQLNRFVKGNLAVDGTITADNHATSTVTNGVTTSSPSEDAVFDFVEAKTFATGSNLQTQITTLNTATGTLKTALASTGSDLSTRIFSTGNNLQTQIDSIVVGTGSQSLQTVTNIGSTTTNAVTIQNDLTVGSSNALFVDDSSNFVGIGNNTNGSEIYSKFSISGSHNTALYQNIINGGNGQVGFAMARSGTTPVRWVTYVPGGSTSLNFFSSSNLMTLTTAGNLSTVGTITATNHATSTVTNGVTISSPSENAVYDFVEGKTFATGSNLQTQINNIVSYTGIVQTYNTGNIKNITTPTEINFGTTTFVDPVIASVNPSYVEVAGDGLYEIEYGIEIKNTGTLPSQVETSILINGLSNYGDVPIRSRASTTLGSGEYRSISKRFYTNLLDIDNIRIKINPNSAKLTVSSGSYMQVTRKN
jgi:hypothetical protein